ncbi:MAG TPA: Na+/H+ antiporter NhaC family protein, partial [Longimicrobiaceae bacterium]|nr:Na+/H+ antiporter NhaC family protein [Longimicrobiaceae bacterium]
MNPRRGRLVAVLALLLVGIPTALQAQEAVPPTVSSEGPAAILLGVDFNVTLTAPDGAPPVDYAVYTAAGEVLASGTTVGPETEVSGLRVTSRADLPIRTVVGGDETLLDATILPGWVSILPPLLAIALALVFKEVIISLFAGVWLGAFLWTGLDPLGALLRTVDTFAMPAVADQSHASIMIFSLMIGGMVGVIGRNGGTFGIVDELAPYATTPRRGLLATYAQGLAIFFDDYANTLIVGHTMRPVTDRLRVSREKLAYIVDSTAAPVASIVIVSTWVGFEITLIADGLTAASESVAAADPALSARLAAWSPFNIFIDTIPYRFYPILALIFVFMVIWMRRDFGPMLTAENRAARGDGLYRPGAALMADTSGGVMEPGEDTPRRWWNAGVPVMVVVVAVLVGLYVSGRSALGTGDALLRDIFGAANSYNVLLWASLLGSVAAIAMTLAQRLLSVAEVMEAWISGIRAMMLAMVILVLAWSLGSVTEVLGTAQYLSSVLEGAVPVRLLPVLVFAIAAAISFATGTSWGTMAILLPLVIPLGANLTAGSEIGVG